MNFSVRTATSSRGSIASAMSTPKSATLCISPRTICDIIFRLLPAGSITGAPKPKTVEIIAQAEDYRRGFYTGIMGHYADGQLDSAVMIRFIEQENGQLHFKAGGGITAKSRWESEYNEVIQKIYVPIY